MIMTYRVRNSDGDYTPGTGPVDLPGVLPLPTRPGSPLMVKAQVWHKDYNGTRWVVTNFYASGRRADLLHPGTGDTLRNCKTECLTAAWVEPHRAPESAPVHAWAPAGTAGEHLAARVIASGDQVLVNKSYGVWSLANAENTQHHSVWAEVIRRERRVFTVRINGEDWPVGVRNLDVKVVRRIADPAGLAPVAETAFPRTELETVRDKVNGHLEAAREAERLVNARVATRTPGALASDQSVVRALEALAKDLGL